MSHSGALCTYLARTLQKQYSCTFKIYQLIFKNDFAGNKMGERQPGDTRSAPSASFVQVHQGHRYQGWLGRHLQNAG